MQYFFRKKKTAPPQPEGQLNRVYYNWYTAGIGIGTVAGLAVFVYGGRFLVAILNTNQSVINYIIGTVFLVTACIQLYKLLKHKGLAENTEAKGAALEMAEETAD